MRNEHDTRNGLEPDGPLGLGDDAASGDLPALQACGLTLAWGAGEPVCTDVDLVVRRGETVCLVGRSGVGKTTILHALAGLSTPREGRVYLHGEDVTGQPGRVSYMLQKDLLLPSLTVIDNACLPLTLAGMPKREAREQARPLLERFGLQGAGDKWPSELSGGMRQRAAFLRTYLMGNDVVMLDEPFSALDAITREDMRSWFRREARSLGLSTLMITHDVDEACLMADRIYVLGRVAPEEPRGQAASVREDGARVQLKGDGPGRVAGTRPDFAVPARIVGEVVPERARFESVDDFSLAPEFLVAKRRVLEILS